MIDWKPSAELNKCSIDDLKARFERFPGSGKRIIAICDGCGLKRNLCFQSYHALCNSCAQIQSYIDHPEFRESKRLKSLEQWSDPEACAEMSEIKKQWYIDNPDAVEAASIRWTKYWADQTHRDEQEDRLRQFNKAHPEVGKLHSEWLIKYYSNNPKIIKVMSDRMIQYHIDNPKTAKIHSEFMIEKWSDQDFHDMMVEIRLNSESVKELHDSQRGGNDIVEHHWLYDDADLSKYTMPMTRSEHTAMHNRMRADGYKVRRINSETDENGLWGYR